MCDNKNKIMRKEILRSSNIIIVTLESVINNIRNNNVPKSKINISRSDHVLKASLRYKFTM